MLPGEGIPERVSEAIQRQNEAQDAFLQRYQKALMLLTEASGIFRAIIDGNGVNQTRYYEMLKWLRKYAEQSERSRDE